LVLFFFVLYTIGFTLSVTNMERPTTPTRDMTPEYQGSPIVGSPGRVIVKSEAADKPLVVVKMTDVNLNTPKKVAGRIAVKGRVEKSASLGSISNVPGKTVQFFAVNLCDDVSRLCHVNVLST